MNVLEQALEALEKYRGQVDQYGQMSAVFAIDALKEAIAKQGEPVGEITEPDHELVSYSIEWYSDRPAVGTKLYTSAPSVPEGLRAEVESLRQQLEVALSASGTHVDQCNRLSILLAELEDDEQKAVERCVIAEQQLAECQAREKVLRDALIKISDVDINNSWSCQSGMAKAALAMPSDSTALDEAIRQSYKECYESARLFYKTELDEAIKQAKREALLELSDMISTLNACEQAAEIRRMAEEMK